jgi:uncharacterized protein YbjQ (UPF0145 family)
MSHPGPPEEVPLGPDDLPEAADRRLTSGSFSSGLTVPDFAACLEMGMRPVGLVQGFCVMKWSSYGAGSPYARGLSPFSMPADHAGAYAESYQCPHGFVSGDHRMWGQNYEQPWVEAAWAQGFGSAYQRLVSEAKEVGAHGIIGITDTARNLADMNVTEFHIMGTAVVIDGGRPPPGGEPWTTYLAGQRLGKLIEAGLMPVSVTATLASVRVWAYCMTDYLMEGRSFTWGGAGAQEVDQVVRAHMAVRQLARERLRRQLGHDSLHGAHMDVHQRDLGEGDEVIECKLLGTRVRRFKDFDPVPAARPTVSLA